MFQQIRSFFSFQAILYTGWATLLAFTLWNYQVPRLMFPVEWQQQVKDACKSTRGCDSVAFSFGAKGTMDKTGVRVYVTSTDAALIQVRKAILERIDNSYKERIDIKKEAK